MTSKSPVRSCDDVDETAPVSYTHLNHTDKEKVRFLKDEYGIGGRSHALSGATQSGEDHDGKGLHYKKQDCLDVHLNWEKVAKRITSLVQKGRYLTEQEQAQYDNCLLYTSRCV